jgi:hypothetical protein
MNINTKNVSLYYQRNTEIPVEMPEWTRSIGRDVIKSAKVGDTFVFYGNFYANKRRSNESLIAKTIITYTVKCFNNEETIMTASIDCDFGNDNKLVLIGNIRAKYFEIKNRKLEPYKTENLDYSNLAIINGTGDFEHSTGSAIYVINGHNEQHGSLGELHLFLNRN